MPSTAGVVEASPFLNDSLEYWQSVLEQCPPAYATLPTPGAPNELAKIELVAAEMGTPLLPFQRYIARVLSEKNPDGSYRYRTALITTPRQVGKTTLIATIATARHLLYPGTMSFYMAQKGKDGAEQIGKTHERIAKTRFGKLTLLRSQNGDEQIKFTRNGSKLRYAVPNKESLHGKTFSWLFWDELFAFQADEGNLILGAASPAQITRRDKQTILISTKGTPQSTFLNEWIKKGRLATEDPESNMCFFEWALPEGLDANDRNNWRKYHPGLAFGLITEEDIAHEEENLSKGEFDRAMMNRQTDTMEPFFDMEKWRSMVGELPQPESQKKVAIAFEVKYDRSRSAIVSAWKTADGKVALKVMNNAPSSDWLMEAVPKYALAKPLGVASDKYSQNNTINDALLNEYPALSEVMAQLNGTEYATACAAFKNRFEDGTLLHSGDFALSQAILKAETKSFGDGGWKFSHQSEPELVAAVVAVRLVDMVKVKEKPFIFVSE